MEMDHDSRVTIEYLCSQPPDAIVRWASDHVSAEKPWGVGWVDLRIADGGPPDMGWVWTIVRADDPDDPKPGQLWCFEWPEDLDLHCVFDPSEGWYVRELPVPAGEPLPPLLVAAYEENARRVGGTYAVRKAWSAHAVSEALASWAARHAGRADLHFEWDRGAGPSEVLAEMTERAAAGGPVWDLGDGLRVVDGLMDDLLALHPDEAAELTPILREAANLLTTNPRGRDRDRRTP
jgi:hypothetical protein